jgi:UDP-N-acetylglucosamine 2-epimerase
MKITSIVGARPQFIKIKPIADEFKKVKGVKHTLIHTGQHYDYQMSKIFFNELKIPRPDYNLDVGSHSHGKQTAIILERIEKVLLEEKPDLIIVYGDTNSTLAGALAAAKLNIPVAHIEAGLRSFRNDMPEEINRVLTDHISTLLFCPTRSAVKNLKREGIVNGVFFVGDVMLDVLRKQIKKIRQTIIKQHKLISKEYILLTIHRQENTDNPKSLIQVLRALNEYSKKIVFPVHPRTKDVLVKYNGHCMNKFKNLFFIKPVSYADMLALESNAAMILTDSGGVQKEAYFLKVPCMTLRRETEWTETLNNSWNKTVGFEPKNIIRSLRLNKTPGAQKKFFGEGYSAKSVIRIITQYFRRMK